MRMLTLHRPWAWCVVYGPKRVENRTWKPPDNLIGEWLAIHAGKTWSAQGAAAMLANGIATKDHPDDHPAGAIIGVGRLIGYATSGEEARSLLDPTQERWFSGPFGWLLTDMKPLATPIYCRGFQGVPTVAPHHEVLVRAQVDLAT